MMQSSARQSPHSIDSRYIGVFKAAVDFIFRVWEDEIRRSYAHGSFVQFCAYPACDSDTTKVFINGCWRSPSSDSASLKAALDALDKWATEKASIELSKYWLDRSSDEPKTCVYVNESSSDDRKKFSYEPDLWRRLNSGMSNHEAVEFFKNHPDFFQYEVEPN